jgi:hypothetical protein
MAAEPAPEHPATEPRDASSCSWLHARALWAGLSIITMWLAVLFVGVFGGDFVSSSATNGLTKFPVVIFLLPFVLPATIVVARRGFTSGPEERQSAPAANTQAREESTAQRLRPGAEPLPGPV